MSGFDFFGAGADVSDALTSAVLLDAAKRAAQAPAPALAKPAPAVPPRSPWRALALLGGGAALLVGGVTAVSLIGERQGR